MFKANTEDVQQALQELGLVAESAQEIWTAIDILRHLEREASSRNTTFTERLSSNSNGE